MTKASIDALKGRVIKNITGFKKHGEEVKFTLDDDSTLVMSHWQDCCEQVWLEEWDGDVEDLIGSPITLAVERVEEGDHKNGWDTETHTFYKLATNKGDVNIRWVGTSNGYYSESVDFWWAK